MSQLLLAEGSLAPAVMEAQQQITHAWVNALWSRYMSGTGLGSVVIWRPSSLYMTKTLTRPDQRKAINNDMVGHNVTKGNALI